MATSPLKRISQTTESTIKNIATREDRTFIAQLDRVVAAGLAALGEPVPTEIAPTTPTTKARKAPARRNRP